MCQTVSIKMRYLTERAAKQRDISTQYNAARWAIKQTSLQSALKPENDILCRIAWGKYEFTAAFWEAVQQ
jgi:hypothetical protein